MIYQSANGPPQIRDRLSVPLVNIVSKISCEKRFPAICREPSQAHTSAIHNQPVRLILTIRMKLKIGTIGMIQTVEAPAGSSSKSLARVMAKSVLRQARSRRPRSSSCPRPSATPAAKTRPPLLRQEGSKNKTLSASNATQTAHGTPSSNGSRPTPNPPAKRSTKWNPGRPVSND